MIYLTYPELLHVAARAIGQPPVVRDGGLLEALAARPRAIVSGADAYPTLADKAAALVHSLARNHPLVDGSNRLALAGTIAFLGVNGRRLTLTNDQAYDLVIAISTGELDDVEAIAERLRRGTDER
jgi:death on curing protein